jgi:hypothetical protein
MIALMVPNVSAESDSNAGKQSSLDTAATKADIPVEGNGSGATGTTPVTLQVDAAVFSVTVPTVLPIYVTSDGTVLVAEKAKITNNSGAAVQVTGLKIEQTGTTWTLADYDNGDFNSTNLNYLGMSINGSKTTGSPDDDVKQTVSIKFSAEGFLQIAKNSSQPISYDAKVSGQTTAFGNSNNNTVAQVTFTIGWATAAS